MVWFFTWIMFGVATYIAATNKGRNGAVWWFLGFLLGPFGLLFALLVQPVKATTPRKAPDVAWEWSEGPVSDGESEMQHGGDLALDRKCPFCAEMIKAEAIVCRFCGRDLSPDPRIAAAAAAAAEAEAAAAERDRQFEIWLESQDPPLTNLSPGERASYRQAFEYNNPT